MQDVGENIDDLFRKAADNYMLKEGESNWDEISAQLGQAVPSIQPAKQNKTKQYILTSLLLLLFFAAGNLFNYYTTETPASGSEITKQQRAEITRRNNAAGASTSKQSSLLNNDIATVRQEKKEPKNIIAETGAHATVSFEKTATDFITRQAPYKPAQINAGNYFSNVIPATADGYKQSTIIEDANDPLINSKERPAFDNLMSGAIIQQPLNKDSAENKNTASLKLSIKKKKGMYVGLLAGSGFNSVKHQHVTKPGLDVGIIAGYRFTPKSSVEIGLLYSQKHYYSDGKYFKMDKMAGSMPAGMTITSLIGHSTFFEIPVKFKYEVLQKHNNALYVSAGVSSYVLTSEKNDYATLLNNTSGTIKSSYKNPSGYIAGAFNLSAGYEHAMGKNNSLRIEPYITIPTTGIGIGSLPVTSTGIHILFTL